jgi:hypothetical protein
MSLITVFGGRYPWGKIPPPDPPAKNISTLSCFPQFDYDWFHLDRVRFPNEIGPNGSSCILSWDSWLTKSREWFTTAVYTSMNCGGWDQKNEELWKVGFSTMPTECDGIPRITLDLKGTENYQNSTGVVVFVLPTSRKDFMATASFTEPIPECKLDEDDCSLAWNAVFPSSGQPPVIGLPEWFPYARPKTPVFGCSVPESICKTYGNTIGKVVQTSSGYSLLLRNRGCGVAVDRIALVYWPSEPTSSDICGNDGQGVYVTKSDTDTSQFVTVVDRLTIEDKILRHPWPEFEFKKLKEGMPLNFAIEMHALTKN